MNHIDKIIGIPSVGPALSDNISAHFGHCEYFVGIKINGDKILEKIFALQNLGHSGCMEPVINMKQRDVTDMIVGGIGVRPYMGFIQMGINLYQGIAGDLKKNVGFFLEGKLKPLGGPSCGNHSEGNHVH